MARYTKFTAWTIRLTQTVVGIIPAITMVLCSVPVAADQFVPFVIPGEPEPASLIAASSTPIATSTPRVIASGGHFEQDGVPLRIWGVNNSFGANFPTHAEAERMAARLAAMGVNSVRLHHMDTSWWPGGLWDPTDGATVYAPALERLDYFIDQLAQHGIWVNLNLHVGRAHSSYLGLPDPGTSYDKIVGIFTPQLVAAQRGFADTMLNHVNVYRGVRYADDPAIAFVEITNEDSFFMWNGDQSLRDLPAYYADILQAQYNAWLLERYGSRSALESAWANGVEPLGDNLLSNGDFQLVGGNGAPQHWILEQHGESTATWTGTQYLSVPCLRLDITNDDGVGWHLQINQVGLPITAGQHYTLTFDAAAAGNRSLDASVMQAHDPWQNLGLSRNVAVTSAWQSQEIGFFATADDVNARVNFAFGGESESVYLTNVELRPGGQHGLLAHEDPSAGTVTLFVDAPGNAREEDRWRFLAETEKAYFDGMKAYIQGTLGCGALVTGTIVFGPLGLYAQSDMDFIDAHAYWQHPSFPGTPWDPNNWYVEQVAMSDSPASATLFRLAASRLAGKPFTVSEYNHSAPNDYQAESIPQIASFAAAQGWNGLWIYSYAHNAGIWDDGYFNSFFDIANNPAKFGLMRAGAALFSDSGIDPLDAVRVIDLAPSGNPLSAAAALQIAHGDSLWYISQTTDGLTWQDLLAERCCVSFGSGEPAPSVGSEATLSWDIQSQEGLYRATGGGAWALTGWSSRFGEGTEGMLTVGAPVFAAVTMTALDGLRFDASRQVLVSACGRAENTNMVFSVDRRTVGTNWGEAPVRIEPLDGMLRLPPGRWTCRALAPDGTAAGTVAASYAGGYGELPLSATHGTMWYLLDRAVGDVDGDGVVDGDDATALFECMTGPGSAPLPGCDVLDLSGDNDVDMEDAAQFLRGFDAP